MKKLILFLFVAFGWSVNAQLYRPFFDPSQFAFQSTMGGSNIQVKAGAFMTNLYFDAGSISAPTISFIGKTNIGAYRNGDYFNLVARTSALKYGRLGVGTNSVIVDIIESPVGQSSAVFNPTNFIFSTFSGSNPQNAWYLGDNGLSLNGTDAGFTTPNFRVDTNGNIVRLRGLTVSFPSALGAAGSVLTDVAGNGTFTFEAPAGGGVALSGITAATGDNAIQNGAFNQLWRFTDPGTGEINFEIAGTNSTASRLLHVRGKMTHANAVQTEFGETFASTGGSGGQDVVRIGTVALSTATPLALYSRGNRMMEVGYNANQLWAGAADDSNTPQYSSLVRKTAGLYIVSNITRIQYDSDHYFQNGATTATILSGGQVLISSAGISLYDGAAGTIVANTGDSTHIGLESRRRVQTTISGTVSLSNAIIGTDSNGPWSVQNNSGASGAVTYNLPAAAVGNSYTFTVMDTDGITIDANGTDIIQFNTTATSAGGTIASATVGNTVTIVCVAAGQWIVTSYVGTIAVTWTTT